MLIIYQQYSLHGDNLHIMFVLLQRLVIEHVVKSHPHLTFLFIWAHMTNMSHVLPPSVRPSSYNGMFGLSTLGFVKHYWLWLNNFTQKGTWLPQIEEAWYLCSVYCVLWTWVMPQWMHWSAWVLSGIWHHPLLSLACLSECFWAKTWKKCT